ncbi:MAG: hypothetical protein KTR16_11920 [Acidiferrobacterales bacterium]|nr:hypothetical protein [Acidiferrobacterales bacterium]
MNSKHFFIFSGILLMFTLKQSVAQEDFEQNYDQAYQIRVMFPEAGRKPSIGSGFQDFPFAVKFVRTCNVRAEPMKTS